MEKITTQVALQGSVQAFKAQGKTIGFVPTMGALHEGHLQLVRRCVAENDICVVSVFVNPTQFNDKHDFEVYPRDLTADSDRLAEAGCTILFAPTPETMYDADEIAHTFQFDFGGLDQVMEGRFRPGHFNGVVQVVSKFFRLVEPRRAYFGEKDFQQLAIIRRMVQVMQFDIEIVGCPIVRDETGLARSSRNALLSPSERKAAANIYSVLHGSTEFALQTSVQAVHDAVIAAIDSNPVLHTEYFAIVDGNTLQDIHQWDDSNNIVGCITVYCGKVRLIDNIRYK